MSRLAAAPAALALLLLPAAALAQAQAPGQSSVAPAQGKADELDPKTKAAIDRAVEKAKEDIRNEVRAEVQGAQSAAEFLGAVSEGPKLEFFELGGYYRMRGMLLGNPTLGVGPDAAGRFLFPIPFDKSGNTHASYSSANMRLRLEPTLNVSEHIRVRAQIDVLDNYVLGSSTSGSFNSPNTPYPSVVWGNSRVVSLGTNPQLYTPYISPKQVWGEVQTPIGLLSFGRMPSEWGLGIMANAGTGIDDDFGDTVDRIQFAFPPVPTPIGKITIVPLIDFDDVGALYQQPFAAFSTGQPFNASGNDDAMTYGVKIVRLDTPDEIRRKHERNEDSWNYGLYYQYKAQNVTYPQWNDAGFDANLANSAVRPVQGINRGAYANVANLWFRWLSPRWRVEAELAGNYGQVGDPRSELDQPAAPKLLIRQWGGAIVTDYKAIPSKLTLGGEFGIASGDTQPGFGNNPNAGPSPYGSFQGSQWCTTQGPDCPNPNRVLRNFTFNPAYRVDLILFHEILGEVNEAMYLKPKLHWDVLPGLGLDFSVIYSRALYRQTTASVNFNGTGGSANLGLEEDLQINYSSGDGLVAWLQAGLLEPLKGLSTPTTGASLASLVAGGIAIKFR